MWADAGPRLGAELGARERVERAPQVRHGQAAIHRQALDLVEDRGVGGVELVGAERAADRDDVDGQLAGQQRAHLHRRGVGAQQLPRILGRDVEGVLLAARGVVGGKVERVEVELFAFDLGAVGHFPTHGDEGVGDVFGEDRDRVPRPGRLPRRRQRDVDALGDEHGGVAFGAQGREAFVVPLLGLAPRGVDPLTGIGALVFGNAPQRLARERQR